ncbi:hypothetical protein EDD86DRAFT_189543 [Gorgonomyces haynaldii]|nr:hypothetical protein EDD86DRAFT_189543 [Gorgonomyces haynaldii]
MERFVLEIVAVLTIAVVLIVYHIGKTKNLQIAEKWVELQQFGDEFTLVGENGKTLIQDGLDRFVYFGAGRKNVIDLYGVLELKPRFDISRFLINWATGSSDKDTMVFSVRIPEKKNVLAIVRREKANQLTQNRWDIDQVAKPREFASFPKDFVILTDVHEFAQHFTQTQVLELIDSPYLERITLSDLPAEKPDTLDGLKTDTRLEIVFQYPQSDEDIVKMNKLVLVLVDLIGSIQLSADAKSKSAKIRQTVEQYILKLQETANRERLRNEKISQKKQEAERLAKQSPQQLRKLEEKERVRQMKKNAKKGKIQ